MRVSEISEIPINNFFSPTANSGSVMIAALTLKRNVLAVEEDDWNILGTKSRVLETLAGHPVDAKTDHEKKIDGDEH